MDRLSGWSQRDTLWAGALLPLLPGALNRMALPRFESCINMKSVRKQIGMLVQYRYLETTPNVASLFLPQ